MTVPYSDPETPSRADVLTDAQTGLPNRLHASVFLEAGWALAFSGNGLAVVLMELDRRGEDGSVLQEEAAEHAVQTLGCILADRTRRMDLCARYTGARFLTILPDCPLEQARRYAREVAEGQPLLVSDTLLAAVVLIPTFDPRRAAVEAVTTTGSVTLVQDDTLQVWLGSWSRLLDDMAEDQTEVRTIESLQIVPALSRQVNLRPIYDDVLAWAGEEEPSALMTSNSRLHAGRLHSDRLDPAHVEPVSQRVKVRREAPRLAYRLIVAILRNRDLAR